MAVKTTATDDLIATSVTALLAAIASLEDRVIALDDRLKAVTLTVGKIPSHSGPGRLPRNVIAVVDEHECLTPAEFAKIFKISRSTVQGMIDKGALKSIRVPTADPNAKKKIRRIPWSEVQRVKKTLGK